MGLKSFGQADVIIWIDNSQSITDAEFVNMKSSIENIIINVLECNENRVAVVHYGGTYIGGFNPKIYIESDFTNNVTIANSFIRRSVGTSDYAHEALGLIGKALDNILDANIISTQKTLNRSASNNLVIYMFTDAFRASSLAASYLVNRTSNQLNTNAAFTNYTAFKNNRHAKFVVTHIPPTEAYNESLNASAAISSFGGTYTGTVESYPADPDGPGVSGRYLMVTDDFNLSIDEIDSITGFICTISDGCPPYLTLVSPTNNVTSGIDNRQIKYDIMASNTISTSAEANYLAGNSVYLGSDFYTANNSLFLAKINDCETGNASTSRKAAPENSIEEVLENKSLSVHPNPASGNVTISSSKNITNVTITSFDGKTMYSQKLQDDVTTHSITITDFKQGIYIVNITIGTGETLTERLIVK
ncbi:hypothetical protein Q765_06470 [Flavobacterium rivuli WB 3.3-2 = DSM 21788]|uniref:VWFA domain-containing protein n=2 Tax=Flavobacterium rivuli TaxID=498301 RepID=A0A0A2M3U5_9FLAO|nr:hypothetical protein Q765_06470 [Flavobacterium rivuli WB 3.3-2 = DSM 21788]